MHSFESVRRKWVDGHVESRSGERKRRLQEGHGYAEAEFLRQIWWPSFHNFHYLHPEYEVRDFREGRRYLDFAYIRPPVKVAIEVDGFGPHQRDLSRRQFCDQWVRQMHLINDNWIVIRVGFDDVKDRPKLWQQLFQQMLGRWFASPDSAMTVADCIEGEVIRLVCRLNRSVKLADVQNALRCGYKFSRHVVKSLEQKGWLVPDGGGSMRTHSWKLNADDKQVPL
jgi:hypothetical protein